MLLAGALAVAGCGGNTRTVAHTAATTASTPTPVSSTSPKDCNSLGINPNGMREGTCTHAGITYTIVDKDHGLQLRTLSAKLSGLNTVSALSGTQQTAAGTKFVIVSVNFGNRLSLPQTVDKSGTQQVGLILDGTVYKESVGAEKASDPSSCLSAQRSIAPGKTGTCEVVFEVPAASASDLGAHGRADLYFVDFGSDLAANPPPQTVGQIRLYP